MSDATPNKPASPGRKERPRPFGDKKPKAEAVKPKEAAKTDQPDEIKPEETKAEDTIPATPATTDGFVFNRAKADEAFGKLEEAGKNLAIAAHTFKNRRAAYMGAFVDAVYTVIPPARIKQYQRPLIGEDVQPVKFELPEEVMQYLREKGLRLPTFNSPNPFLTWYQHYHLKHAVDRKYITQEDYNSEMAYTQRLEDLDRVGRSDAAAGMEITRYAKQILACIDMADRKILEEPYAKIDRDYRKYLTDGNPSIAMRLPTERGSNSGGSKTTAKTDTGTGSPTRGGNAPGTVDRILNATDALTARDPYAKPTRDPYARDTTPPTPPTPPTIDGDAEPEPKPVTLAHLYRVRFGLEAKIKTTPDAPEAVDWRSALVSVNHDIARMKPVPEDIIAGELEEAKRVILGFDGYNAVESDFAGAKSVNYLAANLDASDAPEEVLVAVGVWQQHYAEPGPVEEAPVPVQPSVADVVAQAYAAPGVSTPMPVTKPEPVVVQEAEAWAKPHMPPIISPVEVGQVDEAIEGSVEVVQVTATFRTDNAKELAVLNNLQDEGEMTVKYKRVGNRVIFYLS
jgi:hypothetical protein